MTNSECVPFGWIIFGLSLWINFELEKNVSKSGEKSHKRIR